MDKQQKTGEYVENINFSLDTQLVFAACLPVFCCLFARGPDIRKAGKRNIVILEKV